MRLATLLLLAVAFTGCHEFEPLEPISPTLPPQVEPDPVPELPALTLKGPRTVTRGDAPMYKAGDFREAVRYAFQLNSGPLILTSTDEDLDRYYFTEVAGEGRVELRVTAYDAADTPIAFARIWVESRF